MQYEGIVTSPYAAETLTCTRLQLICKKLPPTKLMLGSSRGPGLTWLEAL
jgi:hypothetical protein